MTTKKIGAPKRGRPATGQAPMVRLRMPASQLASVDTWARLQPDQPNRSEAIRRMVAWFFTGSDSARLSAFHLK